MELFALLVLLVAVPVCLLLWTRRTRRPGYDHSDPHANHDIGARGGPAAGGREGNYPTGSA